MPDNINRQVLLKSRPVGIPQAEHFEIVSSPVPQPGEGQVLVRHHYLSLDPYMRGRMNESKSYAQAQPLDEVMIGGTVGEVTASKNSNFKVGDKVVGMGGWQQYAIVDANQRGVLQKVDTTHVPLSAYLGPVGMPGATAWSPPRTRWQRCCSRRSRRRSTNSRPYARSGAGRPGAG